MSIDRLENHTQQLRSGFTIVEMLIIAPIVILVIGTFISVVVNMTGEVLMTRGANVLAYSVQDALNRIEADVKLSTTFLAKNSVTLTSPQGYDDSSGNSTSDFTNVGSRGNMLILNTLATTDNPLSTNSGLIYLSGTPNACGSNQVNQNNPMTMNVIYFVKNGTLWRRTVAPINYLTAGCSVPWQQPSCNPAVSGAFCKTQDNRLVENVDPEDFVLQYFNSASATIADSVATSAGQTDDQRNAALQSDTTVSASLNVDKMIAGRDINQKGTIRSTRLDVNASTIAPVVPDVVPVAPTVAGSIQPSTPTTVNFTWNSVPGATTYSLNYTLDAGGANNYVSGLANSTSTSFNIQGQHGNIVCATVYANSPAGTSPFGSKCITIPLWTPMVLKNNWTDYGGTFSTAAYTKTSSGMVVLKGLVRAGSSIITTLPAGYRPAEQLIFENSSNGAAGRLDVAINGDVSLVVGSNAWFSLDGVAFMPAGTAFNSLTPLINGWVYYGAGWAAPGYMTDTAGRVHIKGLVGSGVATNGTVITTIPAGSRPSEYMHVTNDNSNGNGHISINSAGSILAKGGGNSFLSLQAIFYPASRTDGSNCTTNWCTLPLQNGWVPYGLGYATPRYTKSSDGMVHVKGLIKSGNIAATNIALLPAGFCPKQQIIIAAQMDPIVWSRVDVTSGSGSGCEIVVGQTSSVSAVWTALDSVRFMAEW